MSRRIRKSLAKALASAPPLPPPAGSIQIDAWALGVDFPGKKYVLNLYRQGQNYPEVVEGKALAGLVHTLTAASASGAKVYYVPGNASILVVGAFGV